ncbi:MAG: extracellular solute-binding protein [Clostridia bacterium]
MKRIGTLLLILLLLACTLTGCAPASSTRRAKAPANTPVTLTMLSNWNEAETKAFADAVHQKLPHITLAYEACPIGAAPFMDEVTRRVMHDAQPDLFMTTDTDLWNSGKLLDLTNEPFVSRYNLSLMKDLSGNGSVYFIPGLGDVLCYLYNVEWLAQLGLPVPQTTAELDQVFAAMAEAGKQPFVVPYSQLPTQYIKVLIAGYLSTPKGQQWMSDYQQGKTTMAQDAQWQELWKRVEDMSKKGYLRPQDMQFSENSRLNTMQDGAGFMTTFSSAQYSQLPVTNTERFDLLPLLGEQEKNQMVYTAPAGYFALSNQLSTAENSAKRQAALQVLDLISTTEGQQLLQKDCPLLISYLSDTMLPIEKPYAKLAEIIQKGAYTHMPTFGRGVEAVMETVFAALVEGKITAEEALKACDSQNASYVPTVSPPLPVLGTAAELFPWTFMQSRTEELAIIDFCMDSVRKAAGTDYALELGTAFRGEFFKGELTSADIESVIRQNKKLYNVKVTGQQIWDLVNQGVVPPKGNAWFIAPSGFRYRYQRLADGSGELLEITAADGAPLDLQKTYTVTVSENQMLSIPNVINFSAAENQELPFTLREAVTAAIEAQGEISPVTDGRIQVQ